MNFIYGWKTSITNCKKSVKGINWSGKKVLDIGCSNGSLTSEILKLTKAKEIMGVDSDKERIAKAKKIKNNKLQFLLLDASNMKVFQNNSFGAVFSNMAFQQFGDFRIILKEIYRILKPKGQVVINFNQERREVLKEAEKLKVKFLNKIDKTYKGKKISANELTEEAKKIGFDKIDVKSKYDIFIFDNVDDLIGKSTDFGLNSKENNRLYNELVKVLEKQKTKLGYIEKWNVVFAKLVK